MIGAPHPWRDAAQWGVAMLLAAAAHLAAFTWLAGRDVGLALPPLPDAIQIDLIEPPPAPEPEPAAQLAEAEPPAEPPATPAPEPTPPEPLILPPLPRLPPMAMPEEAPPPPAPVKIRPVAPAEKPPAEKPAAKKPAEAKPAAKATADKAPKAEKPRHAPGKSTGNAAPGGSKPAATAGTLEAWMAKAAGAVSRHVAATRLDGGAARGVIRVQIAVRVAPSGATTASLVRGTGHPAMDGALKRRIALMPRVPAPPDGQAKQFVLPVAIRTD